MEGVRKIFWALACVGVLGGCSSTVEIPFPNWTEGSGTDPASMSEDFKQLARAGSEAEQKADEYLSRVSFTPGHKTILIERLAGPMATAARAARGEIQMPDRSTDPFEVLPYQRGWRMIGRAMAWKIERSVAMEEYPSAVEWTVAATRFGLALTAGSASDAALGYETIDAARIALAPALDLLGPSALRSLGTGIEAALRNKPHPSMVVRHEEASMLRAVQFIQESYRDRLLGTLTTQLGKDIDPAIDYLEKVRSKGPKERAAYFADFASEAKAWSAHYREAFQRNARQRAALPDPQLKEDRPWRRFARHFFRQLEPLVAMRDETLARTRLLGLSSLLQAECKANGVAPSSLTGLSADLTIDPYSGISLVYRPEGDQFLLYSIGEDLKDDGGETDGSGALPDLRVERPRL